MPEPYPSQTASSNSTPAVDLKIVTSAEELAGLASEWDRLAELGADHTALFSCHAWIMRGWQRYAAMPRCTMHVVTMRQEDELVLAAPFVRKRKLVGYERLLWLDSMTPLYNDIVAVRDNRLRPLLAKLMEHLRSLPRVRTLKLINIREDALVAPMLAAIGIPPQSQTTSPSFDLSGFADWESWLKSRSNKGRYTYRRGIRNLQKEGELAFPIYRSGEEMHHMISWLFHRKRDWVLEKQGKPNWISPPETEAFFQDMAKWEADRGNSWGAALTVDDRLVAANLMFRRGGTMFSSKMAFDPAWSRMSPGWILQLQTIRQAIESGAKQYDLMIGAGEWKNRLKEREVSVSNYKITGRAWRRG